MRNISYDPRSTMTAPPFEMILHNGLKSLLLLLSLLISSAAFAAVGLSGQWTIKMMPDFKGNQTVEKCVISQKDRALSVRFGQQGAEMVGTVDGRHAEWHRLTKDGTLVTFTADVATTWKTMRGTWRLRFNDGTELNGKFSGAKMP
jgi:hypothetical protein